MNKFLIILSLLIGSSSLYANEEDFRDFGYDLEKRLFIKADHLLEVTDKIFLARPSVLEKWGVLNGDAEASYNGWTNTIVLKEKNLIEDQGRFRVRSYKEFQDGKTNLFGFAANSIFHEVSHADFDIFIENSSHNTAKDFLVNRIPKWFKRNYPNVNKKTATQELFGYTAGQIVQTLNMEIESIHLAHGLAYQEERCFNRNALEKIAKRLDLKTKLEFKLHGDKDLSREFLPRSIYITGEEVKTSDMPAFLTRPILSYFSLKYELPLSRAELIKRMNSSSYLDKLEKCYSFLNKKIISKDLDY